MRERRPVASERDPVVTALERDATAAVPARARSLDPAGVLALQGTIGNRAVARLLAEAPAAQIQRVRSIRQRRAAANQWGRQSRYGRPLTPTHRLPLTVVTLGNRLRQSYVRHEGANAWGAHGGHYVYIATVAGRASYVGITNSPEDRQAEHGDRFHLHVLNRGHPLTRIEVRGIEQFGINAGAPQNIAQSISRRHPYYDDAVAFGEAFYRWAVRTSGGNIAIRRR